ncbi:MAG: hypothetical protein QM811_11195 [Pirellulales bacterium]
MVLKQFDSLGNNMLFVLPGNQEGGPVRSMNVLTLTPDDAQAIEDECDTVLRTSPLVGAATSDLRQREHPAARDQRRRRRVSADS